MKTAIILLALSTALYCQFQIKNSSQQVLMHVTSDGDVGIQTSTPTADMDINGSIRIRGGSPAAGKVLVAADASGNANWQNLPATNELVEDQILTVNSTAINDRITITDGNGSALVTITIDDDYEANTDNQNLGNVLNNGNVASTNINMNGNDVALNGGWLSGDGQNEGVYVNSLGRVGIGTSLPESHLHVQDQNSVAIFLTSVNGNVEAQLGAGNNAARYNSTGSIYIISDTDNNFDDASATGIVFACNNFSIGGPNYKTLMQLAESGALYMGNGASCTVGGVWQDASSRELKENITGLTDQEAQQIVSELQPVKYNYKAEKDELYLGFIAEDVPQLVASKDRKSISPMNIIAALTRMVQTQQQQIEKLSGEIVSLKAAK